MFSQKLSHHGRQRQLLWSQLLGEMDGKGELEQRKMVELKKG